MRRNRSQEHAGGHGDGKTEAWIRRARSWRHSDGDVLDACDRLLNTAFGRGQCAAANNGYRAGDWRLGGKYVRDNDRLGIALLSRRGALRRFGG
jgi:hypothetical protein